LAAAEAALAEAESRREADATALASRGVELAELQRRLELADWSRSGLQAARDGLEEQLAAAEAAGSERVAALQAELAGRETALAAAEAALAEAESRREADATALASRGVELAELQRRLELADWSRSGLQAARDGLEAELAAVEAALAETQSRREADATALASRGVELAELQRRLELADWSRSGLQAARDDLEERLAAAEARGAALEGELQATVASVPLIADEGARPIHAIIDLDEATSDRLAAQAAELAELRARTQAQADLLAEREAALAALEAEREAEASRRLEQIGAQLGSSLRPVPVTRAAAEGAVEREMSLSSELLAATGGGDDVALLSGRNVAFTAGLLFPSAEAELTPQGRAALNQIALELKQLVDALPDDLPWMLRIDGHTDDLPIRSGRFRSNWELSAARASSVAEYLVDWGLPEDRLIAAGFADTQPLVAGTSEEARSRNRRIELKLTLR
ncbi:MAG TPA: OmpA family protein, partial [Geminicoccaceae bacterium]|nr:OmpA family protein [Geminicoccaceae bacterium]